MLDGGLGAWSRRGLPLSTDTPAVTPAPPLALTAGHAPVLDKAAIDALRSDPRAVILDARARPRFEGQSEPIDARPGHIPGARSAPFSENLAPEAGTLLPTPALAERYRALGALDAPRVACYCGSGVTACHDLLALAVLGRADAALYEGSWSDWARDPKLPAATGP